VRKLRLGDESGDDLLSSTTAEQRLAMMWSLASDSWSLTGRSMPAYSRSQTPVLRVPGGTRA
jgi:hypothetical protein